MYILSINPSIHLNYVSSCSAWRRHYTCMMHEEIYTRCIPMHTKLIMLMHIHKHSVSNLQKEVTHLIKGRLVI